MSVRSDREVLSNAIREFQNGNLHERLPAGLAKEQYTRLLTRVMLAQNELTQARGIYQSQAAADENAGENRKRLSPAG